MRRPLRVLRCKVVHIYGVIISDLSVFLQIELIELTVFKFLEDPLDGGGAPDTIWPFGADSNDVIDIMKKVGNVFLSFSFSRMRFFNDAMSNAFSQKYLKRLHFFYGLSNLV